MAPARLSEAMLDRIRRHRLLEADRQQSTAGLAFGGFMGSAQGAPIAEALATVSGLARRVGVPLARQIGSDPETSEASFAPRCTPAQLDRAGEALGFTLPTIVQQLYLEIGNGGFGPCNSFFEIERMVTEYVDLTEQPAGPDGELWPAALLPVADLSPGYTCLHLQTGAIVDWDPQELGDGECDEAWRASFVQSSPGLIEWLDLWLEQPL